MLSIENSHQELHSTHLELERNRGKLEEIQHHFTVEVSDLKTCLLKEQSKHDALVVEMRSKITEEQR